MISSIRLLFGRSAGAPPTEFNVTPLTVFVGPNNSGKSKVLQEIESLCRTGTSEPTRVIFHSAAFTGLSAEKADAAIAQLKEPSSPKHVLADGEIIVSSRYGRSQIQEDALKNIVMNPMASFQAFSHHYLNHSTLRLDGQSRIHLINQQPAGDLQSPPTTSLQLLFRDDGKRAKVRRIVNEAFGSYFVIDPTNMSHLRVRLSDRAPVTELEERGIHEEAIKFHRDAVPIEYASDGVKAFTGIMTEVMAGDPQIFLIDEPEAFLHPALASKLGAEISAAALESDKRVFASTHSPYFVMGCIQSGVQINIVRLTYRSGVATGRVLPSAEILELMRNPLLRSTGVLNALFYEFVIVTESDTDRAFYQEINERLLRAGHAWGIPNCLFLNAQNKQTIHSIVKPLRQLGIPAAGVVDVDALKEGGTVWSNILAAANIPELSRGSLANWRSALKAALEASGLNMKRDGGIGVLDSPNKEAAENLFGLLADYGIFIVPGGELESWLKTVYTGGHGPSWLVSMFQHMGSDPSELAYVRPSENDVWRFVGLIKHWLADPLRKGIPE
jgi:predicted ATPase